MSRDVPTIWPKVELYVARACSHSEGTVGHLRVKKACSERTAQLWVVGSPIDILTGYPKSVIGCVVTRLRHGKDGLRLIIWVMGANDMSVVSQFLPELEDRARAKHCKSVELFAPAGRRGWVRILKDYKIAGELKGSLHLKKVL